ncbi:hypothetical protein IC354_005003, partial [Salmonella enterica]|nr:hypothetical protein [Salmonella enterica]
KKYSADEVKEIATATFKKLNRQRRRAKFRAKKSDEKAEAATSEFYKKKKETSKIEFFYNQNMQQLEKTSVENSTLKTQNLKLKQSQSDLELVRKFLPDELQSLVVRAKELASGGDSGGTKHTAEPAPAADLTTYKRPKYK